MIKILYNIFFMFFDTSDHFLFLEEKQMCWRPTKKNVRTTQCWLAKRVLWETSKLSPLSKLFCWQFTHWLKSGTQVVCAGKSKEVPHVLFISFEIVLEATLRECKTSRRSSFNAVKMGLWSSPKPFFVIFLNSYNNNNINNSIVKAWLYSILQGNHTHNNVEPVDFG